VVTGQYDNNRSGVNTGETVLNLANVNPNTFGQLGAFAVDGEVRAQPLYIPSVSINGRATNVLFVATMHNSIYAFDALRPGAAALWKTTLAPSTPASYAGTCPASWATGPEMGILGTPVIDAGTGTLYAVYSTPVGASSYGFYIAALDITTGVHRSGSPAAITATVAGSGYDSSGGVVSLNGRTYIQRTALALTNGHIYFGLGSCGPDPDPYHGWVLGYSAANVSLQTSVYNSTPNGSEGAVWQSGRGIVVDNSGNLYASTGNGTNQTGCGSLSSCDASDSVVRFNSNGQPAGIYSDPDEAILNQYDLDLSASGPLYVPSTGLILAGGKEGILHVLNAAAIGSPGADIQDFVATKPCGTPAVGGCYHITSLVYWDNAANPLLYIWGSSDGLRAYRWNGSGFNTAVDSEGSISAAYPGGSLALSVNGSDPGTAIVWATTPDGILHAFRATNVANEIYNSNQNSARDALASYSKFVIPTVADGRVFVATGSGRVQVYGLLGSSGSASASFVRADATTQGNWQTRYGAEGYNVLGDQAANPAYAAPAPSGQSFWVWAASTSDPRALQKASNPADHVAATLYAPGTQNAPGSFLIDTNITDNNPHQVAIYCLDWDTTTRRQTVDVLDTNGNILNTQALTTSFNGGVYLIWTVTGHVIFRVSRDAGYNAVVAGLFFGGPLRTTTATATFVNLDTATQGNWRSAYGADGYYVEGDTFATPAYAAPAFPDASTWTWTSSTGDTRALQKAEAPDRIAATWYSASSFLIDTNITDGNPHQVALYCMDWDTSSRQQRVDVLDSGGNTLDTRTIANFNGGVYLVWRVSGHVIFRVTWQAGYNGVVEGLLFGGASSRSARVGTAAFVGTDSATQGTWQSSPYGKQGYVVAGDATANPAFATPAASGQSFWVWANSTSDVRALQKAVKPSDRVAATWYSQSQFLIDTNISDNAVHQVALYCYDWDSTARRQTIEVLDANGNVLNTQALASSFNDGIYLIWNVTGHVVFRVTWNAGANAVVQGLFF